MKYKRVVGRLRELEKMRGAVRTLEVAMEGLTPEERIVLDRFYVRPKPCYIQELCQLLQVEQSTVYRRKNQALQKLEETIFGEEGFTGE